MAALRRMRSPLPIEIADLSQLDRIVAGEPDGSPVLIYFYSLSEPSAEIEPSVQRCRELFLDLLVVNVNVDSCGDVAGKYGITSTPAFILERDGGILEKIDEKRVDVIGIVAQHVQQSTISNNPRQTPREAMSANRQ